MCTFGARRADRTCASSPKAANKASTACCKHTQPHPTDAPSKQCACVLRLLPLTPFISPAAPNQVALHGSSVHGAPFLHQAGFGANYQSRTPADVSCPSCSSWRAPSAARPASFACRRPRAIHFETSRAFLRPRVIFLKIHASGASAATGASLSALPWTWDCVGLSTQRVQL